MANVSRRGNENRCEAAGRNKRTGKRERQYRLGPAGARDGPPQKRRRSQIGCSIPSPVQHRAVGWWEGARWCGMAACEAKRDGRGPVAVHDDGGDGKCVSMAHMRQTFPLARPAAAGGGQGRRWRGHQSYFSTSHVSHCPSPRLLSISGTSGLGSNAPSTRAKREATSTLLLLLLLLIPPASTPQTSRCLPRPQSVLARGTCCGRRRGRLAE